MHNMPKIKLRLEPSLIIIIVLSLVLFYFGQKIPKEIVTQLVESSGPSAPIVYIVLHQISFVFAPISGFPFLVAGFYLFGKNVIIYNYFVVVIGSAINFWIAKRWGRQIVRKLVGEHTLTQIDSASKAYGKTTLIALRMFQGGIGDFVSYAYGLTNMKFHTYMVITALATIPGSTLWYYIISKTNNQDLYIAISLFLAAASIIIFFLGSYVVKRLKSRGYL